MGKVEVKVHGVEEAFTKEENAFAIMHGTKFAKTSDQKDQVLMVNSPLNGEQPLFAWLGYYDLRTLVGRILTIIDASYPDGQQRKAIKDLIKKEIWFNWVESLQRPNDVPVGIPGDLE